MGKMPPEFETAIRETLGQDATAFLDALSLPPFRGLRLNPLKPLDSPAERLPFLQNPVPFSPDGYYIDSQLSGVGNLPLHHAGAFYLQEPSAMSAVTALAVQEGDRVLDLCAAPGGKATQIAGALRHTGLIWANELVPNRAQILLSNFERMGVRNGVVSCEHPDRLCSALEGYFDKVLVDAPCSGEGMLRREEAAVAQWRLENRAACASRQRLILESAAKALRRGGVMVYSTCTLSGEENEGVISVFLQSHPEFTLEEINDPFGRPAYQRLATGQVSVTSARRILPADGGEGHFVARFRKKDGQDFQGRMFDYHQPITRESAEFLSAHSNGWLTGIAQQIKDAVLVLPKDLPSLQGLRILRAGVLVGTVVKSRIEPAHHFYSSADLNRCASHLALTSDDPRTLAFLRGEEIDCVGCQGYTCVSVDGVALGFGKASGGRFKNKYPKGLRLR